MWFIEIVDCSYLTIIWVASRYLFVRYLLGRLWTCGHQTWQERWGGSWKRARENETLKFQLVAMEIAKFSHSSGICPMVLNFLWWDLFYHRNLPAKNEQNLPSGSRDRPSLATAWQPMVVALMKSCMMSLTRTWRHRAWRHRARHHCDVRQISAGALSIPNFEFLKSDHY